MQATPILTETLNNLRIGTRRVIHQGGQYSGKTVNILGALATLCSEELDGKTTTVTAQSFPHLKGGALRDFEDYVYPTFKHAIKQYHKTDHIFTFKSGSRLEFKVFESEMAARGQKRKRLFVNEANSFDKMVWFQLDSRSDQSIIDYNPSIRFWAHEDLIGRDGNVTLYSDHRHNPFLTPQKHAEIEALCEFTRDANGKLLLDTKGKPIIARGDYELWKVYARGITGNVLGVIFPNWQMIDDNAFPENEEYIYSIDFGYTNDPTAIVRQVLIGNTLYVDEIGYETGLSVQRIKQILKENQFDFDQSALFCEHDPDMIRALRNEGGIYNALPARKGQGSINAGIELLHRYNVKYTARSRNLHRERGLYIWETDKVTGKLTNLPIDQHNHTFDAIRYGAYTRYLKAA